MGERQSLQLGRASLRLTQYTADPAPPAEGKSRHAYTRAEALHDGVLIDISAVTREAGIRYPVALTRAVWERCVIVPPDALCQDEAGRLWDVAWVLACAVRRGATGTEVRFGVHARNDNRERTQPLVRLKAVCGPRG